MIIDAPQKEHLNGLRNLWKEAFGDTEAFLDGFFENVFSADFFFSIYYIYAKKEKKFLQNM